MKGKLTLSIDGNVLRALEGMLHMRGQLSKEVEGFLRLIVAREQGQSVDIDIEIERMEQEKQMKVLAEAQSKLTACRINIKNWEKTQTDRKKSELQRAKKLIDEAERCAGCNDVMGKKRHLIDNKYYCGECFLGGKAKPKKKPSPPKKAQGTKE